MEVGVKKQEMYSTTARCFSTAERNCSTVPCVLALETWPAARLSRASALLHLQKWVILTALTDLRD